VKNTGTSKGNIMK